MSQRLVIIGGNPAGMSGAAEARRGDPDLDIVVLERTQHVSYASCGMPYWLGGVVEPRERLLAIDLDTFREKRNIDVRLGAEATEIDTDGRAVVLSDGQRVTYDRLLIATGARPVRPPIPGIETSGVFVLRDMDSAITLKEQLPRVSGGRALMVGSGPIGMEMCENLCRNGIEVHLLEVADQLLPTLSPNVAAPVAEALVGGCTSTRLGSTLESIEPGDDGGILATIDGRTDRYDMVLLGTGVKPNSELAAAAGCALGPRNAIAIDATGRTSVEHIWAAGDCATAHHRVTGEAVWIPLATTANTQGRVAGRSITGRPGRFPGVLGSWVSSAFGVGIGATGLTVEAALDAGFDAEAIERTGRNRSGYMPGSESTIVRLVWDRSSRRLLGAETSGGDDVATRLHALAVAISARMTVDELAEVDFGYAPPVAALRDPIELAAAAVTGDAP
ncbi:MAG: FAD-dependent oxidoreductase [Actinobacteria bacterium]|nr:FAD-dependent oxidoreductase [Thermoleophilia bacterium]MCB9011378.1 FAD-dependent oxidoreductase [Actinomycetota bacterium]